MAQYKHNFYGTSYYGATNAYSGIYESNYINTDETLVGTADFKIKVQLPKALYANRDAEIVIEPYGFNWTQVSGTVHGNTFEYETIDKMDTVIRTSATSDSFKLHYLATADSVVSVNLEVRTWTSELAYTSTNHTIPIQAGSTAPASWELSGLTYGTHDFLITFPVGAAGKLMFGGFEVGATHVTVETRASLNEASWTTFVPSTYTKTLITGDWYYLEGTTPSYAGKNRLQVKLFLASSDNEQSPVIENILTTSGNTNNRTEDGTWIAEIDMAAVATAAGKSFRKVLTVDWTDTVPVGTKVNYRSRSSVNNTTWSSQPLSVPYVKNTNRLRLKKGKNYGYVTTQLFDPSSTNVNVQNLFWFNWIDKAHLPSDTVATGYYYEFLDEQNRIMYTIQNPSRESYKMLDKVLKGKPFKLRIQIFKRFDKSSPVVDQVLFTSKMHFTEDKVVNNTDVSAIDAQGTGEKTVFDLSTLTYNLPAELTRSTIEYKLIDETVRPTGVTQNVMYLYFDSEKTATSRTNVTTNPDDKVWVKSIGKEPGEGQGLIRHYQYGGGLTYFETDDSSIKKYEMTAAFTPSLISTKKYRSFIQVGWPTQYHTVRQGETLASVAILYSTTPEEVQELSANAYLTNANSYNDNGTVKENQVIEIPNKTLNENVQVYWESEKDVLPESRSNLTEQLVHNAAPNDYIMGKVVEALAKGQVDWVSSEKIYEGFLNLNNEVKSYQREHVIPDAAQDQEHEHPVKAGETYESIANLYEVDEEDIRWKNNAKDKVATDSPELGSVLIVPSKIVLPTIPPDIQIADDPYDIEIIHNSLRIGNEIMPKTLIDKVELEVIYQTATVVRQPVQRGNTSTPDALPHSKVISVTGVYDTLVENVGAPYYLSGVDYNKVGNYIDWSLTGGISKEPPAGNTYYVSYSYSKPVGVRVKIDSDYQVQTGSDRLWRSREIKEFSGTVNPIRDFREELPPITDWVDSDAENVYDIDYVIEDNDLWTKTWVEKQDDKSYIVGSLMGKKPKDNWLPYIHTGFYYLGKDEYYLFSEPLEETLTEDDIPIAKNVQYVLGKHNIAIQTQPQSTNMIRNSSFQSTNTKATIRKITF